MAKKKCEICGTKNKENTIRCSGCGIPLVNLNVPSKRKLVPNNGCTHSNKDGNLEERTLYVVDRLKLMAKFFLVLCFFSLILLFIYALINFNIILIIMCILLYFFISFVSVPISWMQVMLENIYEMRINDKRK